MTKRQLNKEYAKVMTKAEKAIGRKEAVSLLHRADRIRNQISKKLIEQGISDFSNACKKQDTEKVKLLLNKYVSEYKTIEL